MEVSDAKDSSDLGRFADPRLFQERPWMEYLFILTCILGQLLTQAGSNLTMPILFELSEYYNTPPAATPWFMSSFALTCGSMIVISGRLGDVYGLRLMILLGYGWTLIWSALAGAAYYVPGNPSFLIACRAMQGVGLAFVLPNVIGAAGSVWRAGTLRKHIVFSLIGWAAPVGGTIGPLFGGIISSHTSNWSWINWSYLIVTTCATILAYLSIPKFETANAPVDWIGCGLAVVGLVLFNFVWNQAPVAGWGNPYIIVLLILGVIFLIAFIAYELTIPTNPLLPHVVIRNTRLGLCLLALFFAWGCFGITMYHYFTFVVGLRGYSPLGAAAGSTPAAITGGCAALITPFLIRRFPEGLVLTFATIAFLGGALLLVTAPVNQMYWQQTFGIFILMPFGMDISFPAGAILMSDSLPQHLQGMAGSLIMVAINYGTAFFVGVSGNIETQIADRGGSVLHQTHDAMWLAVGISGAAVVISGFVTLLQLLHKLPKPSDANIGGKLDSVSDLEKKASEREQSANSDPASIETV